MGREICPSQAKYRIEIMILDDSNTRIREVTYDYLVTPDHHTRMCSTCCFRTSWRKVKSNAREGHVKGVQSVCDAGVATGSPGLTA